MATILKAIVTARRIKKEAKVIADAKVAAARARAGLPPLRPWYKDCAINCCQWGKETFIQAFCPCCLYSFKVKPPERPTFCTRLGLEGTYENQVLKNIFGFFGGTILATLWWALMVFQLEYSVVSATVTCAFLGTVLTFGLAFTEIIRCLTFLAVPQLFSSHGRTVLLGVMFVLVVNGPLTNFRYNVQVLSETSVCGQELTYNSTRNFVQSAMSPVKGLLAKIREILIALIQYTEALRHAFLEVKKLFLEIVASISRVLRWLENMVNLCNVNMGGPYHKCKNALYSAAKDCENKLGPFKFLCKIVEAVSELCHVVRIGELLCHITRAIKSFIRNAINGGLAMALNNVYDMFYFNVTLTYDYDVELLQTKTFRDVRRDIAHDVEVKLSPLTFLTGFSHWVLVSLMAWLVIRALIYRYKFLTKDRFDNYYITQSIIHLDEKREEMEKETILPMGWREARKYVTTFSLRLARPERNKLILGLVMLGTTGLHAGFYLACDYCLYNLLCLVRKHGTIKTTGEVPSHLKMKVQGNGILSDIYRSLITEFDPIDKIDYSTDTTPCLPNPSEPPWGIYKGIVYLFLVCLFLVLTEAYGLRLRHVVAGCYYPNRAKERSVYLYNHILRTRGGFLKFARRQLRRKMKTKEAVEKISLLAHIGAMVPLCGKIMAKCGLKYKYCLVCGHSGKVSDMEGFKHCANKGCKGVFCKDCFTDINNMCTACMNPIDYGDMSDISEERDSSDEEDATKRLLRLEAGIALGGGAPSNSNSSSSSSSSHTIVPIANHWTRSDVTPRELVSMATFDGDMYSYGSSSDSEDEFDIREPASQRLLRK